VTVKGLVALAAREGSVTRMCTRCYALAYSLELGRLQSAPGCHQSYRNEWNIRQIASKPDRQGLLPALIATRGGCPVPGQL